MRKSSTVTERADAAPDLISATGSLRTHAESFTVSSTQRVEIVDLTDRVRALVAGSHVKEGLVNVFSTHTTCGVFINEFQGALVADMKTCLERVVGQHDTWLHNDPVHSDCDRSNADAHLRAMLLGHSLTLQLSAGDLVLGQWQRVLMAELDGPRDRALRLQVIGVG